MATAKSGIHLIEYINGRDSYEHREYMRALDTLKTRLIWLKTYQRIG